jgi:hypothetical protein
MRYPKYPNIYPQFAHDPLCRCCHPNDRPYCDCPCHRAEPGEIVALRARWDTAERIPAGPIIGNQDQPPRPVPPAPAPPVRPPANIDRAARLAELRKKRGG